MEQKRSAREIAIDYILTEIKNGHFRPGDKLMTERKLSEQLQISRVPLREAISTLSTVGILEARQGDGTFITEYHPNILAKIIKTYGLFDRALVDEVFEARILLEADAAKLAASNRTLQDLECLRDALSRHEEALPLYYDGKISAEKMMEYDGEVHLGIAASSHNNFIVQMIEVVRHVTSDEGLFGEKYTVNANHFRESADTHRKIFRAIEQRDAGLAYQTMQEHILQVRSALDLERLKERIQKYDGGRRLT